MTRAAARQARQALQTHRERGAVIAYFAASQRLRMLDSERQLDLWQSRLALRREWLDIQTAAAMALA